MLLAVGLTALAASGSLADADPVDLWVIAHPGVPVDQLSKDELTLIFTLSKRQWADGTRIAPFNYEPETALRVNFDRAVLQMESSEVAHFWIDRRIRGGGVSPRTLRTPTLMARVVAAWAGAIGYVPAGIPLAHVKIVARISKGNVLPEHPK